MDDSLLPLFGRINADKIVLNGMRFLDESTKTYFPVIRGIMEFNELIGKKEGGLSAKAR